MGAFLYAISPDVWHAAHVGYEGDLTIAQAKSNARARNALIEALSKEVFARIDGIDLVHEI